MDQMRKEEKEKRKEREIEYKSGLFPSGLFPLSSFLFSIFLLSCSAPVANSIKVEAPVLSSEPNDCAGCHPAAVNEWRQSQHAISYTNGIFQSEFKPSRQAWCVSCHGPLAKDPIEVDDQDSLVKQGVSCAACHFPKGEMVSTQKREGSPHETRVDPTFGAPDFCGGCHQFNFPILGKYGVLERYTQYPMQETLNQYVQSGMADTLTCLDCHARTPGKHRYPGSHNLETLQSTLRTEACFDGTSVQVRITNKEAAHHVPSGGVHRFMALRVWRSSSPEKLFEAYIGRKFKALDGGGKETISDTTFKPKEERLYTIEADALGDLNEPINLELRYIYALHEQDEFPDIPTSGVVWFQRSPKEELPSCKK
jgi:hypothetical protein